MFASRFSKFLKPPKFMVNSVHMYKVLVAGGTSKLGQTISLLLRDEPGISCLTVYDSSPYINNVISDLQNIPAESEVRAITKQDALRQALHETDILLATDGVPETVKVGRQELISANVALINMISYNISKLQYNHIPFIGIASEPTDILVPIAAEIIQHQGKLDPKKLFGLCGVDSLRAQVMYAELHTLNPLECSVPVVCGHSSKTAVPLLSQATPHRPMCTTATHNFTEKFRQLGMELTEDCPPTGLAAAYNAILFTRSVMRALDTRNQPAVNVFVDNNSFGSSFFAGRVTLSRDGAGPMQRYTNISEYECSLLEKSILHLNSEISECKKFLNLQTNTVF